MNRPSSRPTGGKSFGPLAFLLGAASFAAGLVDYYFPNLVTAVSLLGLLCGLIGIVLAILVRKSTRKERFPFSALALVLSIIGIIWNLSFFIICTICSVTPLA